MLDTVELDIKALINASLTPLPLTSLKSSNNAWSQNTIIARKNDWRVLL